MIDKSHIQNVKIDGIDEKDLTCLNGAYISYAEDENGVPLEQSDLNELNDDTMFVLKHARRLQNVID